VICGGTDMRVSAELVFIPRFGGPGDRAGRTRDLVKNSSVGDYDLPAGGGKGHLPPGGAALWWNN